MRFIHIFKLQRIAVLIIALFCCQIPAYAASKDQAVTLAQEIMLATVETQKLNPNATDRVADVAIDIVLQRRSDNLSDFIKSLDKTENLPNTDLFQHFSKLGEKSVANFHSNKNYEFLLLEITKAQSWTRQYLSNLLLAQAHVNRNDVLNALKFTGQAIEIVNQQPVTLETTSMIYDAHEVLQTAYIYDRSTDQAIEAMSALKELALKAGRPLDGFSIVNNLAVLFSSDGRHLEAIEIMNVMEPYLDGQSKEKIILYNFSIAKFKNKANLHAKALPHLEKINNISDDTWLRPYIYNELAQSYAYLGEMTKSEAIMTEIDRMSNEERPKSEYFELSILNTKSQIAELRGDHKTALRLKKQYSKKYIDKINAAQFQDRKKAADRISISQRVATQKLENAARESALKDVIIDREKNLNRITIGLLILAAIMVGLLVYGVWRQKSMNKTLAAMNVELEISRDKALASERVKSDFLAMMSHEIRTPLNSIIPVAEILQGKSIYKEDRSLLSLIVTGGNTLLQMLDNVLVLSKGNEAPSDYSEDLNPVKIIKPILNDYGDQARKKGLTFTAKAEKGFPLSVHTDKKAFEKILSNLLSNAVKFTSEGVISVIFSRAEDEDYFSITIRDSGIGMKGENLDLLLEPFRQKDTGITRSYDGLGIGLSVTHIEVKRLGGELNFNTNLTIGTEVEVILPIAAQLLETPLEQAA